MMTLQTDCQQSCFVSCAIVATMALAACKPVPSQEAKNRSQTTRSVELPAANIHLPRSGDSCADDPACFNRFHPDVPFVASAESGDVILFGTRDAADGQLDPTSTDTRIDANRVHPLTGPVGLAGANVGDVVAVTILDIAPEDTAWTSAGGIGFLRDLFPEDTRINWRLNRDFAVSDALPGVRIPYAAFPGVVGVLPGPEQVIAIRDREMALLKAGGFAPPPSPAGALPEDICGPNGYAKDACLRTIPPRENGGNMDIQYMRIGTTVLLPCFVDGCGLAIGDVHYAQGDGEVAGSAIEMSADVLVRIELRKGLGQYIRSPQYAGGPQIRDAAPAKAFYATTGIPIKEAGWVPPNMQYLSSPHLPALTNLSRDVTLSARNALIDMIDYMVREHELTRLQAYYVASVAVDLRIGQVVDGANYGATAILPLSIFETKQQ